MSKRKTRERQLAKLAARRAAERRRRRRRRILGGVVGGVAFLAVALVLVLALTGGNGKPRPKFDGPPPLSVDAANTYVATMETSCGTITFKLLASSAPFTVNSFVFLARHHYFDGQYFHRLDTSIDALQGVDPKGT